MALHAGILALTIEYGQGLKDGDWFGRQDPYAIVKIGGQTFRTRTAIDGGKNPVWNETFSFNIINENTAEVKLYDEDTWARDDPLGEAVVSLARVREAGQHQLQVPVVSRRSHKQHGFISVGLRFTPNASLHSAAAAHACHAHAPPAPVMSAPAPYASYPPAGSFSHAPAPYPYPVAAPGYPYPPPAYVGAPAPPVPPPSYPLPYTQQPYYPTPAYAPAPAGPYQPSAPGFGASPYPTVIHVHH